jgi:hypothetical protein
VTEIGVHVQRSTLMHADARQLSYARSRSRSCTPIVVLACHGSTLLHAWPTPKVLCPLQRARWKAPYKEPPTRTKECRCLLLVDLDNTIPLIVTTIQTKLGHREHGFGYHLTELTTLTSIMSIWLHLYYIFFFTFQLSFLNHNFEWQPVITNDIVMENFPSNANRSFRENHHTRQCDMRDTGWQRRCEKTKI